jgi:excinuclease ABC subunit A
MLNTIKVRGARQHNLQNVDVDIPKDKFVVVTGVSGSGKSSLAFDTIYAEGQRRYVESLSAYARQFLGVMDKPDVDLIEGLSPSISIDQKTVSHNPRSTVGTITEVYDYLRLLYARIGHPHCPNDGTEIRKLSVDEIVEKIINEILRQTKEDPLAPQQFRILSPIVRQRKGEFRDLFENIRSKGYNSIRIDKRDMSIDDDINLIKTNKHDIDVVIDTISAGFKEMKDEVFVANLRTRIATDVEQSTGLSDGLVVLATKNKIEIKESHPALGSGPTRPAGGSQNEGVIKKTLKGMLKQVQHDKKNEYDEHLYSEKFSCPTCGLSLPEIEPRMFSFNSPLGACEKCKGIGTIHKIDPDLLFNPRLSINEGGILPFNKFFFIDTWYTRLIRTVATEEGVDLDKPTKNLSDEAKKVILYGTGEQYRVRGTNRMGRPTAILEKFDGVIKELERRYYENTGEYGAADIQKYMREELCDVCLGLKLKPEVLAITIDNKNISEFSDLAVYKVIPYLKNDLPKILNKYETEISKPILKEIIVRLSFLENVGLQYLTISRKAKTLSGGELQRIRLASQIGTGLTGVLYVLDEPSIGLHPRDVSALIKTLHNLKDLGNTLIVVEHDEETIESAEYAVELGPRAGKHGGKLTFTGTVEEMKNSKDSITGQYLSKKKEIKMAERKLETTKGKLIIRGASQFNLKNVDIEFPIGNLISVTGVSGSGKSTLIVETLYPALKQQLDGYFSELIGDHKRLEGHHYVDRVYLVDQSPIGRTPRSNPATYIGFFDDIRDIFASTVEAKARGFQKGRFSFNLKGGRCEKCQGGGVIKIEMQFLPDVYVTCDVCEGHRYNKETLEVKYKGKTIYDVLNMTVDEAIEFFIAHTKIHTKLQFLQNVGLGYITLGQPAPTFSGGEAQRIKLANELSHKETGKTIYILDEPTTGLHFYDIQKLLNALYQLVERGNTVIVIEHNLDVIKNSQYIIDMGPEGGDKGGEIVYQGPLKGILEVQKSYTGQYLKKVISK